MRKCAKLVGVVQIRACLRAVCKTATLRTLAIVAPDQPALRGSQIVPSCACRNTGGYVRCLVRRRVSAGSGGRGSGPGRWGEDGVGSYAPPDDVRLAGDAFSPVAEGRPPVAVPCHLEYARVRGHAFHAQARPEGAVRDDEVRDEGFLDDDK